MTENMQSVFQGIVDSCEDCLDVREKFVLYSRNGYPDGKELILEEVAKLMGGITRERVRQIECKSYKKISNDVRKNSILLNFSICFDEYSKEICKPFNENEKQILSLAFGLNDNKIWPTDVLASTLAISENSMSTIVKNICINFLTEENIKRLSPGIQYCKEKGEDFFYKNGYSLLLKNINELCKKAEQDE